MSITKYLLIIILLLPQVTQAIYRVYSGNIGDKKVELYIGGFFEEDPSFFILNNEDYSIHSMGIPKINDNKYMFENYTYDAFDNEDSLTIQNLNLIGNQKKSEDDILLGTSAKFGDVKLEKKFEYNIAQPFYEDEKKLDKDYKKRRKEYQNLINNIEFNNVEFLQMNSTKDFYFKLLVSKKKKEDAQIVGINIYSKKNGELIQCIKTKKNYPFCEFNTIEIGDFDFDNNENDFTIVDGITRGPNVPHKYFIYDKSQNKFIDPNLEGYVFNFDYEKRIATDEKICGDVIFYQNNIILNKMYYFNKNKKKYNYIDQYCIAIPDDANPDLRKCTIKEKQDCEKAVVEPGDEP